LLSRDTGPGPAIWQSHSRSVTASAVTVICPSIPVDTDSPREANDRHTRIESAKSRTSSTVAPLIGAGEVAALIVPSSQAAPRPG